jgi:hypothetical protein
VFGGEVLAVPPVPGSTAASAVFIGAPPMKLFETQRRARRTAPRARARVLPGTAEILTREVCALGHVGIIPIPKSFSTIGKVDRAVPARYFSV